MEPKYKYLAVDFDGTLCEHKFPEIGEPKENVIKAIRAFAAAGTKIILHTCRDDFEGGHYTGYLTAALMWCQVHAIPIDAVNENPWETFGRGKMYADRYIDDRAVNVDDLHLL